MLVHVTFEQYLNRSIKYRIPDDYNADICPEALVEVEVGLFYKTLIFLDSKTSSFGMKHYLHLRWKGIGAKMTFHLQFDLQFDLK